MQICIIWIVGFHRGGVGSVCIGPDFCGSDVSLLATTAVLLRRSGTVHAGGGVKIRQQGKYVGYLCRSNVEFHFCEYRLHMVWRKVGTKCNECKDAVPV